MREEVDRALSYLGEQCIVRIRDRSAEDSWIDHTGNLRSSIGYAVYDYGKKYIESTFAVVRQGGKGASEGRKMVNELASKYANVYALVVVAGMNYAEFVEAIESKDVLASTESWARTKVDEYLNKAKDKAINRINKIKL
ncbi:hypothetical protein [Sodaliphilus pleomorphus]|uniref:Uncharacterized protein n=1 Tax=Sodaliphilus pleomorphus TaxID=2606626 RepID=A0A6L5XBY7_9BACT|nr:hypothetical protein [Sodaliphilus pleomorphus]MSS16783.1 hypothetical protein [Sodaliphilus pleomorphus]